MSNILLLKYYFIKKNTSRTLYFQNLILSLLRNSKDRDAIFF